MIYISRQMQLADPLLPCATYEIKFVNYYAQIILRISRRVTIILYDLFFVYYFCGNLFFFYVNKLNLFIESDIFKLPILG